MLKKFGLFLLISMIFIPNFAYGQFVSREAEQQARSSLFVDSDNSVVETVVSGPKPYKQETEFKIAIIVNGEIITAEDINDRIRAFSFNTRIPLNSETVDMIKDRVVQNTIDEKIKVQEAKKEGIIITDREVDEAIESFVGSNGISSEDFYKDLRKENVSLETFRDQMKSDLSWLRLVRKKTAGEIEPSQKEINRTIDQIKKDFLSERYMLSEIIISKKTAKNLNDLVYNLRNDPRFQLYAMQFSEAPSSSTGGSLGWVNKDKLYPQLQKALQKMKDGDVSEPIEVGDDYYIIKLDKKHDPIKDKITIPNEKEVKNMIEGKRLEEFAGNYLNKLRQKAIIEIKD